MAFGVETLKVGYHTIRSDSRECLFTINMRKVSSSILLLIRRRSTLSVIENVHEGDQIQKYFVLQCCL